MKRNTYSYFLIIASAAFLGACGSSSSSDESGGDSTSAIAGLWELPEDSALGFNIAEISSSGTFTNWIEDTVNNCYNSFGATLVSQGNNSYGYVPAGTDQAITFYTLVNEGDSLHYTSTFLGLDESWQAVEGVSTSDFNSCT